MELKLPRFSGGDEATLGLLFMNGAFFCYTLEDQYNEPKIPGETIVGTLFTRLGELEVRKALHPV